MHLKSTILGLSGNVGQDQSQGTRVPETGAGGGGWTVDIVISSHKDFGYNAIIQTLTITSRLFRLIKIH